MSLSQQHWDLALTKLSHELVPTAESLQIPKSVCDKMFRALQSKSRYKIDRSMIMGSVGKKTALEIDYDFDCVIFVNKITVEDFESVKTDFDEVLTLSNLDVGETNNTPITLKVTIEGLDFDLVPAINFRDENWYEEQQWKRALSRIDALPNPARDGYKYSSSLEERQIKFIKEQSAFVHDLIRLAKYWNKTIFITDYLTGRSSLIECIATFAANQEEKEFPRGKSVLRAFKSFLELVVQFDTLCIVFERFYKWSDIDDSIAKQRPLVMDPSNPYNNMAYGLVNARHIMEKFQGFAKTTIERLALAYSEYPVSVAKVFQSQPAPAPTEFVSRFLPKSTRWLVAVEERNIRENPKTIVRNGDKLPKKGKNIVQTYLCNNIEIVQGKGLSKDALTGKVTDIIDSQIYGRPNSSGLGGGGGSRDHSKYSITYEIPCGDKIIKVSLDGP